MGTLRISGGTLRGRRVALPQHDVRPTSARAREAYFNVVAAAVPGAAFLDLFAGSGIFSLEAASRGASRIVAVDRAGRTLAALAALAREWNLPIETMRSEAADSIARLRQGEAFDLVYLDPPYDFPGYAPLIGGIDRDLPLSPGAVIAVEHRSGSLPFDPQSLSRVAFRKTTRYGNVSITYLEAPE